MAKINPFKGVRPSKSNVQNFSSKSFKTYSKNELEEELKKHPTSFLSIINIKKNPNLEIEKPKRYELVKEQFEAFKASQILITDAAPSYYIYETVQANGHLFCGVIATAHVEDYDRHVIKKHEATISKRENTFKNYLETVRFNAAAVLLTYPDDLRLETAILKAKINASDFNSWTTENEAHKLWCVDDPEDVNFIQKGFENIPSLYIADGHHRSASSALLARELKLKEKPTADPSYNHFLTYLIPESQLKIYDYNRVIKDLNGLSTEAFLEKISVDFEVEYKGTTPYKSSKRHDISMYLEGAFYSLSLRATKQNNSSAIEQLDTYILQTHMLEPILGITNVRTNLRIGYIYGSDSMEQIKTTVDRGAHAVGFGLFPIEAKELMDIADSDAVMPPKSTYIYPKLRSGITIYEF
ncbi:DUF1015 domain-containing protein [Flavobacteriaceae bacterium]|nr:DUF1015 domain-containing protein [Flavobacteriaceae bacterium]